MIHNTYISHRNGHSRGLFFKVDIFSRCSSVDIYKGINIIIRGDIIKGNNQDIEPEK